MKILLAIDGSSHSQDAVDEVAKRPWPLNSIIRVLSVFEPYTPPATEFVLAGATLDLIVVGSHGRTGITRLLLGSVAEAVVGHAHCSIEVVRRRQPVAARSAPMKPS